MSPIDLENDLGLDLLDVRVARLFDSGLIRGRYEGRVAQVEDALASSGWRRRIEVEFDDHRLGGAWFSPSLLEVIG